MQSDSLLGKCDLDRLSQGLNWKRNVNYFIQFNHPKSYLFSNSLKIILDWARGADPRPKKLTGSAQILDLAQRILVTKLRPLMAYPLSMPEVLFT